MTNEEKLKTLLIIATNNGWNSVLSKPYNNCEITPVRGESLQYRITTTHITEKYNGTAVYPLYLDQLVGNSYPDEISFIEALCKASNGFDTFNTEFSVYCHDYDTLRRNWISLYSNQRLDWLLKTFNHLL